MGKYTSLSYWRRLASRVAPSSIRRSISMRRQHQLEKTPLADLRSQQQQISAGGIATIFHVEDETKRSVRMNGNLNGEAPSSSSEVAENSHGGESVANHLDSDAPETAPAASSSSAVCHGQGNVTINSQDVGCGDLGELDPTYLESYLTLMFYSCMSPFKPNSSSGGIWGYGRVSGILQQVLYWIFAVLAILHTFGSAKYFFFAYVNFGGLHHFINMGFFGMSILTKLYSLYLLTMQQKRISNALQSVNVLRAFAASYSRISGPKYSRIKICMLYFFSIFISIMSVIFAVGIFGWTPQKAILHASHRMANSVLIWSTETYNATLVTNNLKHSYGTNLTTFNMMFGTAGIVMQVCSIIQTNILADLLLTVAATVHQQIVQLARETKNPENDVHPVTIENFVVQNGQWSHYLVLKKANDDFNNAFDFLLRYMHVVNLAFFVFFILNAFDGTFGLFRLLLYLYMIIKISCMYKTAAMASDKNENFRNWICRLAWKSTDQKFIAKAFFMLYQIKEDPLGLGKGMFKIDEGFLFRFLGTVGSVFVMQVEALEKDE